jgi:hypothetical protein
MDSAGGAGRSNVVAGDGENASDGPRSGDQAPHAAAEVDSRDPSRAANQAEPEPVLPTPAHDTMPSTQMTQPDAPGGRNLSSSKIAEVGASAETRAGRDQADVNERGVTDPKAAPGTSESMLPVQGVHTPDVGPGGAQFDTDEPAAPRRAPNSR